MANRKDCVVQSSELCSSYVFHSANGIYKGEFGQFLSLLNEKIKVYNIVTILQHKKQFKDNICYLEMW